MTDEKRVVLIKPGDVLVIGNLGDTTTQADLAYAMEGLRHLGLSSVLVFVADIDIDVLNAEEIAELATRRNP